ncbi:hypothetical protein GCE86_17915 [Micromonospora terminaliae]|uniref:Uncharacterized protein n=1 Tax=Micromonospora terminaliae TaxID=1914461 RepID=A0ABX6E9M7_9ACTN|nr:hypothetical protein GCE86_17915 [Micromonospora terminaliae]
MHMRPPVIPDAVVQPRLASGRPGFAHQADLDFRGAGWLLHDEAVTRPRGGATAAAPRPTADPRTPRPTACRSAPAAGHQA